MLQVTRPSPLPSFVAYDDARASAPAPLRSPAPAPGRLAVPLPATTPAANNPLAFDINDRRAPLPFATPNYVAACYNKRAAAQLPAPLAERAAGFRAYCRAQKPVAPWLQGLQRQFDAHVLRKEAVKRDWKMFPALLTIPDTPRHVCALGDVHADYAPMERLLVAQKIIEVDPKTKAVRWIAGDTVLVQTGDLIDKGGDNLKVLHFFYDLQQQAQAAGGRVVVTLGNHEASFLKNPTNSKTSGPGGILFELWHKNLDPKAFVSDRDPIGYWLRRLPIAVSVGGSLFLHAGQTNSQTPEGFEGAMRAGIRRFGFGAFVLLNEDGPLRARGWYGSDRGEQIPLLARLMRVRRIGFGHDGYTLGHVGHIRALGKTEETMTGLRIDCCMSRGVMGTPGELLHITYDEKATVIEAGLADGTRRKVAEDHPQI